MPRMEQSEFYGLPKRILLQTWERYQQAVVTCLKGLRSAVCSFEDSCVGSEADGYDGIYRGEDPEYGLESDLLWKVVRQLEKLLV